MYAVCNKNRVLAQMQCRGKEQNPVWGHHLHQRLSKFGARPFFFGVPNGFQIFLITAFWISLDQWSHKLSNVLMLDE